MFEYVGVSIRAIEEDDLDFMRDLRSEAWPWLGDIEQLGSREQRLWFDGLKADPRRRYYILSSVVENLTLGIVRMTDIDRINRSACVGGDIVKNSRGQGYGKRMYALIKKWSFHHLGLNRIWLWVIQTNAPAIAVYEKMGFTHEGRQRRAIFRNGGWLDYLLMGCLVEEYIPAADLDAIGGD